MAAPLKICYAASEMAPFAKTGGLGDVSYALPRQLHRSGHDVRPFLPLYQQLDRGPHPLRRVESVQDAPVRMGWGTIGFSLWTAPLGDGGPPAYFVDCPELLHRPQLYTTEADEPQRFVLFTRAVIESCQRMGWGPDVFHCHDWHTALVPLLLRTVYGWDALFHASATMLTIHNLGYQGVFGRGTIKELGLEEWTDRFDREDLQAGRVNLLRTGLAHADLITTVSPTYAREIQTDEYGMGLQGLLRARGGNVVGILNGVDYEEWSPERDPWIPHHYSRKRLDGKAKNKRYLLGQVGLDGDAAAPLVGIISRLVHQKGFDLCFPVLPELLSTTDLRLVVLGMGEADYERFFDSLQRRFPGRAVHYRGYSNELAHLVEAGSDMLLMPSRYEPCGLNQLFSLRYGTIPVVRRTGGLADSVEPFDARTGRGTGFVFEHFTADGLRWALDYALRTFREEKSWKQVMANAMAQDFSWERQVGLYAELYSRLAER